MLRNYFRYIIYLVIGIGVSSSHAGSYEDFFSAIKRDDPSAILGVLLRGFDPNSVTPDGQTGLILALRDGALKAAEVLIDVPQTQVEFRNRQDESALMMASLKGHLALARKLVRRGADVNKPGWTPLHYAATGGHVEVIRFLLDEHAYIDAESPNGTTPLMMAAHYGTDAAVQVLLEAGADAALRNERGLSAQDFAMGAARPALAERIGQHLRRQRSSGSW